MFSGNCQRSVVRMTRRTQVYIILGSWAEPPLYGSLPQHVRPGGMHWRSGVHLEPAGPCRGSIGVGFGRGRDYCRTARVERGRGAIGNHPVVSVGQSRDLFDLLVLPYPRSVIGIPLLRATS